MKFKKALVPAIAAAALLLAGCTSTSDSSTKETAAPAAAKCDAPILIGAAMAQTGFMSPFDGPALTTAQIAVDKINAAGGVNGCQLKLEAVDTETNPDKGQQIATDFVSKGAKLLLVTCDYDINAKSSQVANNAGVLVIAPCVGSTAMGPDNGLNLGFSLGSAVPGEAAIMAEYAYEKIGKTATLFKDMSIAYTTSQCDAFEARFKELGGTVKSVQQFSQTQAGKLDKPVTAQVANAKKDGASVIALCSYPGGGAEAAVALAVETLDGPDQAEAAHLAEVLEAVAAALLLPPCDLPHQRQVGLHHGVAVLDAALLGVGGEQRTVALAPGGWGCGGHRGGWNSVVPPSAGGRGLNLPRSGVWESPARGMAAGCDAAFPARREALRPPA